MSAARVFAVIAVVLACALNVQAGEIHGAAARGDIEQVELLLKEHPEWLDAQAEPGNTTPLMAAADGGSDSVVKYLLEQGANWRIMDRQKETALYHAVKAMTFYLTAWGFRPEVSRTMREKYPHVVSLLLDRGADINLRNAHGYTPLQFVTNQDPPAIGTMPEVYTPAQRQMVSTVISNRFEVAEFLIAHGADIDIFSAAGLGKVDRISTLLDLNRELINERDADGDTPLHWAARLDQFEAATVLLDRGAKIDSTTGHGFTPLADAAFHGNKRLVELLIARGAGVNTLSGGNLSPPLYWAMDHDHRDVIESLLEHGATINMRNGNGDTSLFVAAGSGDKFAVDLLLKHKADVNAGSARGETSLMAAAYAGNRAVAEALLAAGADKAAVNLQGKTALQLAEERGKKDLIKLLQEHGRKK